MLISAHIDFVYFYLFVTLLQDKWKSC